MDRNALVTRQDVGALIRHKASRLLRAGRYSPSDKDDLEQEFRLRLWLAWPAFDSARGEEMAFVTGVTDITAQFLLRGRLRCLAREKRIRGHRREPGPDPLEQSDIKMDVAEVRARMGTGDTELTDRLMEAESLAGLARELGIPRSTIQRRIERLRPRFAELHEYL